MPNLDPASVAGKPLPIAERTGLLVVGAGPAGLAAAIEGARRGLAVTLVDENPIPAETMGDDLPLWFGQRMTGAVRNRQAMTEAFVGSEPLVAEAFEAGVDLRLGTAVWGLYANGPMVGWLPGPVAGLADNERSWLMGFDQVIVAAGRRDMALAFPGWDLPGVMGATAAERLATRYGALDARRAVILGSGAEALAAAEAMRRTGVTIAAVVEAAHAPLVHWDIPVLCGQRLLRAEGGPDGVSAMIVSDGQGERRIAADAVVAGIGAVPVVELLSPLGCRLVWDAARGGQVPVLDTHQRASLPFVFVAGDAAGVWPAKSLDRAVAEEEGRRAAAAAAGALQPGPAVPAGSVDLDAYRSQWIAAAGLNEQSDTEICRCEGVTARELLHAQPPRYLGWTAQRRNSDDLAARLGEGPPHPDQIKRLTRAGMGVCQGRRCREQVVCLLARASGTPLGAMPAASYRAPVRPLPLALLAAVPEPPELASQWDSWFAIPGQWTPYWEIEPREIEP